MSPLGPVAWHEELGSTNDEALARLARGERPPFVVWAGRQTVGRGQGSNRWWSTEGALTFSVAIDPAADSLAAPRWPCLALATAVGICRAVDGWVSAPGSGFKTNCRTDPREPLPRFSRLQPGFAPEEGRGACVKWPNDVWWGDRKLAGVLVEVSRGGESVGQTGQGGVVGLVVGIGLNLNNRMMDRDLPEVKGISVCEVDGREHPIEVCLSRLLDELARVWSALARGDGELAREWGRRSCLDGRRIRVRAGADVREGMCGGLGEDGTLRLLKRDESTGLIAEERLVAGRVEILRDEIDTTGW